MDARERYGHTHEQILTCGCCVGLNRGQETSTASMKWERGLYKAEEWECNRTHVVGSWKGEYQRLRE